MNRIDWTTKEIKSFTVEGLGDLNTIGSAYCQTFDNRLFISGGRRGNWQHLHEVVASGHDQMEIVERAPSTHRHASHALIPIGKQFIVAASGVVNNDYTNSCELYAIAQDKWNPLPPLNIARADHSGCVVGEKNVTVYVFGGFKAGGNPIAEIEWLDLTGGQQWQVIRPDSSFSPRY